MVDYGAEMIDLHAERLFEAKWIRGTLRAAVLKARTN